MSKLGENWNKTRKEIALKEKVRERKLLDALRKLSKRTRINKNQSIKIANSFRRAHREGSINVDTFVESYLIDHPELHVDLPQKIHQIERRLDIIERKLNKKSRPFGTKMGGMSRKKRKE